MHGEKEEKKSIEERKQKKNNENDLCTRRAESAVQRKNVRSARRLPFEYCMR